MKYFTCRLEYLKEFIYRVVYINVNTLASQCFVFEKRKVINHSSFKIHKI